VHDAPHKPAKTPRNEHFPVASLVLARDHRAAVLAFYRFARLADDVADAPGVAAQAKLVRLAALQAALRTGDPTIPEAAALHEVQVRHGTGAEQAVTLLDAFRQDAGKARYADWAELLAYCGRSANPVGRFLLELHGEDEPAFAPADGLCTSLQILNHLQDMRRDREDLDRIYLPVPWLERAGGEAAFFAPANAARRAVLDAALDRVDALIDSARILPRCLASRRLAAQSEATIALADRLAARLRVADPVLQRVQLGKADAARALVGGVLRFRSRDDEHVTKAAARRSGSSFRFGMRSLAPERRRGIHALYAFCRAVDDIADGAAPPAEKRRFLTEWRDELDRLDRRPETPVGRELAWTMRRFQLPIGECHALLEGMETDCAERVRLADDAALDAYARRVAGSVGLLCVHVFGAPEASEFALGLGRTLQLVNILRDVDEDAALDRVYVPLARLGCGDAPAGELVADARFARAWEALAHEARAGFADADRALAALDAARLKPAVLMLESYRRILDRLQARGWHSRGGKLRLTAGDRLQLLTLAMRPT
jgi:phytoene synthase